MATSTQQDTSQVLAQAHASLYNNHIALSASPALPQHPPSTVPIISEQNYSTLSPYPTQSTPVLNTVCQQTSLPLPPPPVPQWIVYNMQHNDQQCVPISNSNMQMVFNNIQTINDRLHKIEKIMSDKLPKLDVLDVIKWKLKSIKLKPNKMNIIVY
jgi:hypothetical protein